MQRAPSAKTEQEIFTDYIDEINPPKNFDGNSPVGTSDRMCAGCDRDSRPHVADVGKRVRQTLGKGAVGIESDDETPPAAFWREEFETHFVSPNASESRGLYGDS
jgi:hypothetical protein